MGVPKGLPEDSWILIYLEASGSHFVLKGEEMIDLKCLYCPFHAIGECKGVEKAELLSPLGFQENVEYVLGIENEVIILDTRMPQQIILETVEELQGISNEELEMVTLENLEPKERMMVLAILLGL